MRTKILIGLGVGLAAVPFVLAIGLYRLAGNLERADLETWALSATVGLVIGLPLAFLAGRALADIHVRGFLSGIDTGLEKVSRAVDFRDRARVNLARETRKPAPEPAAPNVNVFLPNPADFPKISHREPANGEIIDL